MKKTKKALATLAIAGMALTTVPFNALADNAVPNRLAGTTAEQTAVQIAEQMAPTSGIAILASSASYGASDALTAGPLAAYLKAPILLQGPDAALNADTKAELSKLNVKTVYVTSGTAVIKQSVINELAGMGISVESLGGNDRFETSVNIAKKMVALGAPVKKVAVAYGWLNQDALSIAAIASAANEPILLTEKSALPASAKAFLADNGITSSDVIGGTGVIDASVMAELPSPTRHFGQTAYDTNNQVIQDFASSLKFDTVYLANGITGIDALAGAPLAALTDSPIVLTDGADVPAAATFVHGKMSATGVVTALGGAAVVPDAVRTGVASGQVTTPAQQGALAVTSVSATAVNAIKVVFNQAPADTSKVTFAVTMGATDATVSPTWNDAKTEATLTSSANYATGDYVVKVTNDGTDLGSSTVTFTAQRIGKIAIDSNVLAVTSSGAIGYAGYHVYDQYGVDITTNYLASDSNIKWTCGIGTVDKADKGLLTIKPFSNTSVLTQYTTAVITANTNGQSIPASASATLNVSTTQGTISDITLNKLTSADNAIPTIGDSEKYYVDYSAKDMGGNDTKNLTLMEAGLITNSSPDAYSLITSNNSLVTAKIVADPNDDQKAALEVTIKDSNDNYQQDQPITITVSTFTGKTSSMTFTLRRKQQVDNFTLMAPTANIPSGKTGAVIPFTAVDQSGKAITKYSDLKDKLTLTPDFADNLTDSTGHHYGLYLEENADGTASLKYDAPNIGNASQAQQETLSASVKSSGKFSTININVDLAQKVDSMKLDDSIVVPNMENGAVQKLDFGFNDGGLQVLDQYGAIIDMTSKWNSVGADGKQYFVRATSSNPSVVSIGTNDAYSGHEISLVAANDTAKDNAGSATINFKLYSTTNSAISSTCDAVDTGISKSMTVSVLKDKDITGYVLDTAANPLYANADKTSPTAQENDWVAKLKVYGTNSSGSKVYLDPAQILARTSSSTDFTTTADTTDGVKTKVVANKLADTKTGSDTTVSVTVYNQNDMRPHTATTAVKSITDSPVPQSVGYYASTVDEKNDTDATGITTDGNTVTVDMTGTQTSYTSYSTGSAISGEITTNSVLNAIDGRDFTRYNVDNGSDANRGYVYIYALDQFGSKAMNLSSVIVSDYSVNTKADGVTAKDTSKAVGTKLATMGTGQYRNTLYLGYKPVAGDYIVVSGVSSNGLVETVKIVFK